MKFYPLTPPLPGGSLQFYASYPAERRRWWFQMSSLCSGRQNSLDDWASRSRCSRSRSRSPPGLENRGRPPNWEEEWVLLSWRPDEDSWPPADLEMSHEREQMNTGREKEVVVNINQTSFLSNLQKSVQWVSSYFDYQNLVSSLKGS